MNQVDKKYILLAGFGWSGASAVHDLLREYKSVYAINDEFDIVRYADGLMDLRYHLVTRKTPMFDNYVIERFRWLVDCFNRKQNEARGIFGRNYEELFQGRFLPASEAFINRIITDKTQNNIISYMEFFEDGRRWFNDIEGEMGEGVLNYAAITGEAFDEASKDYINQLFMPGAEKQGASCILLFPGIMAGEVDEAVHYFDDYCMITVDRDIRDVYASFKIRRKQFSESEEENVMHFVKFARMIREGKGLAKNERIINLRLEDLIYDYKKIKADIEHFIGLNQEDHNRCQKYFKPEISERKVGRYKQILSEMEKSYLENELPEACYL